MLSDARNIMEMCWERLSMKWHPLCVNGALVRYNRQFYQFKSISLHGYRFLAIKFG
jgi:hypothetical protein